MAVAGRVNSGVAIDDTIDRGVEIVRTLKDIMRLKYADDPVVLAEWIRASHVEKAPRRAAAAPAPPTTPAPGSTPPQP